MLKHTVLIKVKDGVPQHEVDTLFSYVHDLKNSLMGMMSFTYGKSANLMASDSQFTHGYSIVFVDEDYFQEYLKHPKYQEAQQRLSGLLSDAESLMSFNYEFG